VRSAYSQRTQRRNCTPPSAAPQASHTQPHRDVRPGQRPLTRAALSHLLHCAVCHEWRSLSERGPHHAINPPALVVPCGRFTPWLCRTRTAISEVRLSLVPGPIESVINDGLRLLQRLVAARVHSATMPPPRFRRSNQPACSMPWRLARASPECTVDRQCRVTQNRTRELTCGTRARGRVPSLPIQDAWGGNGAHPAAVWLSPI